MQTSILLDILKTVERETFVHSLVHFPNDQVETRSLELHTGLPLGPSAFLGTFKQRARIGGGKKQPEFELVLIQDAHSQAET